jgi:hypothetical protein
MFPLLLIVNHCAFLIIQLHDYRKRAAREREKTRNKYLEGNLNENAATCGAFGIPKTDFNKKWAQRPY